MNRSCHSGILSLLLLFLPIVSVARAAVIFDNGIGVGGISSAVGSDPSANSTFRFMAEEFRPTSNATVTTVRWSGMYSPADTPTATDSFTLIFYADSLGLPGAVLNAFSVGDSVWRTDSTFDVFGYDIYSYTAAVNQPVVSGINYWLSIVNDTTADTNDSWLWGRDSRGVLARSSNQATWESFSLGNLDFALEGTVVPEPGTATLLFGGLLCVLARRRR